MDWLSRLKGYVLNAGWWSERVRQAEQARKYNDSGLLGRYDGRMRHLIPLAAVLVISLLVFANSSSCDRAVYGGMGGEPRDDLDQWKQTRSRDTLRFCESNRDEDGVKVCDE